MPDAGAWVPLISAFLRGADRALLERIVEALLANERIPPFARFGLQEDLEALQAFQQGFRERAPRGLRRGPVSHERMRRHIRRSVRRAD
jgi:hypothetical protein